MMKDRTKTEEQLMEIYQQVLGRESINYDQSFENLGGDSIAAMLCISRIRSTFNVGLTIEDFFIDNGSVESIAAEIEFLQKAH